MSRKRVKQENTITGNPFKDDPVDQVYERLRIIMEDRRLTNRAIAKATGIHESQISRAMKDGSGLDCHWPRIAWSFKISLNWLLFGLGQKNLNYSTVNDLEKIKLSRLREAVLRSGENQRDAHRLLVFAGRELCKSRESLDSIGVLLDET